MKRKVLLYGAMAYLWTIVDDAPVNLDSPLSYSIGLGSMIGQVAGDGIWYLLDISFHLASLSFFYLAIREARR